MGIGSYTLGGQSTFSSAAISEARIFFSDPICEILALNKPISENDEMNAKTLLKVRRRTGTV